MKRNREIFFVILRNTRLDVATHSIAFTCVPSHSLYLIVSRGKQREDGRPFMVQMDDDGYRWIKAEDAGVTAGYGHYHMLLSL